LESRGHRLMNPRLPTNAAGPCPKPQFSLATESQALRGEFAARASMECRDILFRKSPNVELDHSANLCRRYACQAVASPECAAAHWDRGVVCGVAPVRSSQALLMARCSRSRALVGSWSISDVFPLSVSQVTLTCLAEARLPYRGVPSSVL
jgi:hypothetical protein